MSGVFPLFYFFIREVYFFLIMKVLILLYFILLFFEFLYRINTIWQGNLSKLLTNHLSFFSFSFLAKTSILVFIRSLIVINH